MVFQLLGELGSQSLRDLARNLFPGFYERGISANQALRELREAGLGYKRQDFLRDFAQGQGTYSQETRVRFVNPQNIPSDNILQSQFHGVPDKYSFVFKYSGVDKETGESADKYFFYHRNTLDSKANMENDAYDWLSERENSVPIDVESVSLVEGYINPVWA